MKSLKIYNTNRRIELSKVFCLGYNYFSHITEMGHTKPSEPVIFMKPLTSIIGNKDKVIIPAMSEEPHYEVELVVVMGKGGKNIPQNRAYDYVFGYAVGLDITLRDIQRKAIKEGKPWTIAKGFDTSAPISEVVQKDRIKDPHDLNLRLWINDELRQDGNTNSMVFKIPEIINYISSIFNIERGDLILTGTPEGVGELHNNDKIRAEIKDIINLECNVLLANAA